MSGVSIADLHQNKPTNPFKGISFVSTLKPAANVSTQPPPKFLSFSKNSPPYASSSQSVANVFSALNESKKKKKNKKNQELVDDSDASTEGEGDIEVVSVGYSQGVRASARANKGQRKRTIDDDYAEISVEIYNRERGIPTVQKPKSIDTPPKSNKQIDLGSDSEDEEDDSDLDSFDEADINDGDTDYESEYEECDESSDENEGLVLDDDDVEEIEEDGEAGSDLEEVIDYDLLDRHESSDESEVDELERLMGYIFNWEDGIPPLIPLSEDHSNMTIRHVFALLAETCFHEYTLSKFRCVPIKSKDPRYISCRLASKKLLDVSQAKSLHEKAHFIWECLFEHPVLEAYKKTNFRNGTFKKFMVDMDRTSPILFSVHLQADKFCMFDRSLRGDFNIFFEVDGRHYSYFVSSKYSKYMEVLLRFTHLQFFMYQFFGEVHEETYKFNIHTEQGKIEFIRRHIPALVEDLMDFFVPYFVCKKLLQHKNVLLMTLLN